MLLPSTPALKNKVSGGYTDSTLQSFVKHYDIGIRRFRILGDQGLEYWGVQGGANSQEAHDVVTTSHRRHFDVMCPLGF